MVRGAGKTMAPLAIPAAVMVPAATAGAAVTGGKANASEQGYREQWARHPRLLRLSEM